MTAGEAIARVDALAPNPFPDSEKLRWLQTLVGLLGAELPQLGQAAAVYDTQSVLLVPEPHTELYLHWLQAKALYYLGEFTRYQNAAAQFNQAHLAMTAALIRAQAPVTRAALRY